jgi:N-acetylglucosamine repressor
MSATLQIQPSLLGKINERQVLGVLREFGPQSRAEVARRTGLSAPTVSKAAASLLKVGLLEENDTPELGRGRPAKRLRLACERTRVLGIVIDAECCSIVSAGLDGRLLSDAEVAISTPRRYDELIEALATRVDELASDDQWTTLGIGLSVPGLIDSREGRGVLSPNVPQTNGQAPAIDLQRWLGIDCVMLQECHGLCLAERHYGLARGLDDFAMLEVGTGVGLGVMSGGSLLTGHNGLAGEIGHLTVVDEGERCGCGNLGCLETEASDSALARRVSKKLGRPVNIDRVIELARAGRVNLDAEIARNIRYLSIGMAAVINLFNPSTLFVHGRQFAAHPEFFDRLVELTRQRTLGPAFSACRVVEARGSKKQGAIAGIVHHLTSSLAPGLIHLRPIVAR